MSERWSHAICDECWATSENGRGRLPTRLREPARDRPEVCCWCERLTTSGIYVREDPADVPCGGEHLAKKLLWGIRHRLMRSIWSKALEIDEVPGWQGRND